MHVRDFGSDKVEDQYGALFTLGDPRRLWEQLERVMDAPELLAGWKENVPQVKTIEENVAELEDIFSSLMLPEPRSSDAEKVEPIDAA